MALILTAVVFTGVVSSAAYSGLDLRREFRIAWTRARLACNGVMRIVLEWWASLLRREAVTVGEASLWEVIMHWLVFIVLGLVVIVVLAPPAQRGAVGRLGTVVYLLGCGMAVLFAAGAFVLLVASTADVKWLMVGILLLCSAVSFGLGKAIRFIAAGN